MRIKVIFSFVFCFLLLISLVSAVPPHQISHNLVGLELKTPSIESAKINMPYEFEVHVFNSSNGVPMHEGISCFLHLYNATGNHIAELEDNTASHQFDYSFNIDAGNFTEAQIFAYIIQCNTTTQGGFDSSYIEITPTGKETVNSDWIIIILIIIAGALIVFGIAGKEFTPTVLGAFLMIPLSIYIFLNGLGSFTNSTLISQMLGAVLFAIGAWVGIKSIFDNLYN